MALPRPSSSIPGGIDLSVAPSWALAILLGVFWQKISASSAARDGARYTSRRRGRSRQRLDHHALRVPPLIATLATACALSRRLAEGISQARSVTGYPEWFFVLGQGDVSRRAGATRGYSLLAPS